MGLPLAKHWSYIIDQKNHDLLLDWEKQSTVKRGRGHQEAAPGGNTG